MDRRCGQDTDCCGRAAAFLYHGLFFSLPWFARIGLFFMPSKCCCIKAERRAQHDVEIS